MKKWTDENTIVLIKMYEQYPDLWRGNLKFKNSELRMNLWAHIAEVQETTVDEVQKKIRSLKAKFSVECKRHDKNPAEYFKSKPWKFFNHFKFLMAENEPKSSSASAVSESIMSESNCSSKQFGTEDNSAAPSKLQDESQDFESSMNYNDDDDDDDEDFDSNEGPKNKKTCEDGQDAALVDALHCIKTLLDESDKRDEHSIYGEHIAQKIRTCNRNNTDIAIAQHHIENIIFNLAMGVYNQEGSAALEDKTSLAIPPYIPPGGPDTVGFQPFVIPKPDPETNS